MRRRKRKKLGRRRNEDPKLSAEIRRLRAKGLGIRKVARTLRVGPSYVQRIEEPNIPKDEKSCHDQHTTVSRRPRRQPHPATAVDAGTHSILAGQIASERTARIEQRGSQVFVIEEPDNTSYDPTKLFRIATA
jgi:hypothetical protein